MSLGSALGALAALAGTSHGKRKHLSKDALKVVDAFINGVPKAGGCRVPKKGEHRDPSSCRFTTDGRSLLVNGETLATKPSPIASSMELCFTGTRSEPALRQMASALSHRLGTGIGVAELGSRKPKKGHAGPETPPDWRFTAGRKGHSMRVPKGCVEVVISEAMQARASKAIKGHEQYTTRNAKKIEAANLKRRRAELEAALPASMQAVMAARSGGSFPEGFNPEAMPSAQEMLELPEVPSAVAATVETRLFPDG